MTWLALCDHDERRLSLRGLSVDKQDRPVIADVPEARLSRGSILFETRLSADTQPQVLLGYRSTHPEMRSLTFQALPGGGIAMVQVQGDKIAHAAIKTAQTDRTDVVRITYSWDCAYDWGRLSLERPEDTKVVAVPVPAPCPLSVADLRGLMLGQAETTFSRDMIFAALSDQIEPIGPMPTLLPDTPLVTPWGYKPMAQLRRGDTVVTRSDGVVPVLHHVSRRVPARGSFRPIRMRAPYFGLQEDIIVAPDQRIILDGPEVEYLFGQESVLVPARHLVNGSAALQEPCGPLITYDQLLLPRHETLLAAGTSAESLYVGRLRRDTVAFENSLLRGFDRSMMPEHPRPAHHVLRWYDAVHLARRRAG